MNDKIIGILGGMGPRSTAPFIDQVIDECQKQYNASLDEEFPKMMIYSLPTPFYIDRPIDHELMKKTIEEGLKKLEDTDVQFIAMPCNSAHIYIEDLVKSINIPLLNIVEETLNQLPVDKLRISLFATTTTFNSQIYQKGIAKKGHQFIFREQWQERLNELIKNIKMQKDNPLNHELWDKLLKEVRQDADYIIIACTDLNAVTHRISTSVKIIDSSQCLAHAVVKKYLDQTS
ncbi:amino acid racemase [Elizabethkingia ursingii]|uniref:aspartate/glutamate racemase family protein n=1 Tax=Elizabethkingia ursingii TaxID=1756150 RepID=UPI002011928B|nr:amino acid racemase [Elizabethkingia ursingii]MCL1662870.1 amino acid racemase [Elizabethkingia ursingii]